jgi:hypothetical protein
MAETRKLTPNQASILQLGDRCQIAEGYGSGYVGLTQLDADLIESRVSHYVVVRDKTFSKPPHCTLWYWVQFGDEQRLYPVTRNMLR